jgi:outer membrane protein OmpA-like peptidoglycan-associated protein/tetratricopeptide (TPR) repeat protein
MKFNFGKMRKNLIKNIVLFFVSGLVCINAGLAQTSLGDAFFANFEYKKVIDFYNNNKIADEDIIGLEQLALSYFYVQDFENAEKVFEKLVNKTEVSPKAHLYYGICLKNNYKFKEANNQFKKYAEIDKEKASLLRVSCDSMQVWQQLEADYHVFTIGKLNGSGADFSPTPYREGFIYASENTGNPETPLQITPYPEGTKNLQYGLEIDPTVKYYYSKARIVDGKPIIEKSKQIQMEADPFFRNNALGFDKQKSQLYFSRTYLNENPDLETKSCIFYADVDTMTHKIGELKKLVFHDTLNSFNFGHPYISKDGTTLFFVSDMPGGYGGFDIYQAKRKGNGWGKPQNLGNKINGSGNELFPVIKNDKLYFSSNSFPGYGGLDIFVSEKNDANWTKAVNIKAPINSVSDDFGMAFMDNHHGFFTSNRAGGNGDDDIYFFEEIVPVVIEEVDTTPEIVEVDSIMEITDFSFGDILFAFNSSELTDTFKYQLDSLLIILNEKPEPVIGLYGFTDPQGASDYNMRLSKERAEAVYNYLLSKNVHRDRVLVKAKGESMIFEACETDSCIEAHSALKRRVEVVFNPRKNNANIVNSYFVLFKEKQNKLDDSYNMLLSEIAEKVKGDESLSLRLIGYADSKHVVTSAQKKAEAIKTYMLEKEVDEDNIDIEIEILFNNTSENNLRFNRIELILFKE